MDRNISTQQIEGDELRSLCDLHVYRTSYQSKHNFYVRILVMRTLCVYGFYQKAPIELKHVLSRANVNIQTPSDLSWNDSSSHCAAHARCAILTRSHEWAHTLTCPVSSVHCTLCTGSLQTPMDFVQSVQWVFVQWLLNKMS